jgi:hypothetical protein
MKVSQIWQILDCFKNLCCNRGWKTSQTEDWIETNMQYHNFLWVREIHPESFKRIVSSRKCVVHDGLAYRVVPAAYTAWLFPATIPDSLIKIVRENPDYFKRIALYDLSQLTEGTNLCVRLNSTDSCVFREFEDFLKNQLKVRIRSTAILASQDVDGGAHAAPIIA